ncbi:hypothetical protein M427DRAFT_137487 [Gonapodya prolifera JEL478]|uniref:Uncharacterized protein n=1 Tax=Gonapodya prolifera (strain JEL478) TaxID=1344416 RepID=A0A139A5L6_GONPJ|nr:hypothetical protein M427DRAFT_137487 [Gonapodya prolifera JEL478]|eukprot:KXS12090.1 hypothetical protein M427DRAFT_137487 [Gonapodya prolifera JEL478]
MNDYIKTARSFLALNGLRATENFADDRLLNLENSWQDILGALVKIDNLILNVFIPSGNMQAQAASEAIFAIALVVVAALYSLNFRRMLRETEHEMEAMVNLLHMIPAHAVNANAKLSRLIQSGGIFLNDDDDGN